MKIYFGRLYGSYLQDMLDQGADLFELDGEFYDYVLEVSEDGIKIKDTLERSVPISLEASLELLKALKIAKGTIETYAQLELFEDEEQILCV